MDLYDADHFFGYYNGYIYKLIYRVYNKHGARGLRTEIKYIIQYLIFLLNKLKNNSKFEDYILVEFYFRLLQTLLIQKAKLWKSIKFLFQYLIIILFNYPR